MKNTGERALTVGYLHAGAPEHGVSRYGRLLAGEARARGDVHVIECNLTLTGAWRHDRLQIQQAARELAPADVIHVQYNSQRLGSVWGMGWHQFANLFQFSSIMRVPIVATLHDVYPIPPMGAALRRHPIRFVRELGAQTMSLYWLRRRSARVFVSSQEERARVSPIVPRVSVIPHFVERRNIRCSQDEAKATLGLTGKRVLTLLGYIHGRKGHRIAIDALAELDDDFVLVCAGGPVPSRTDIVPELLRLAESRGVSARVRVTGWLSEEELERYLVASDVGVCPFTSLAASSSLSTWISVPRPIVASDLPQIAEYNALEANAVRTFRPYTPHELASAIRLAFNERRSETSPAIARLRERLLLPTVTARHLEVYRDVLRARVGRRGRPTR